MIFPSEQGDSEQEEWLPTENQRTIVGLYAQGFGRWKIAEMLGVSEHAIRKSARALCWRFDCSVRELPDKLAAFDAEREFSFLAPPPAAEAVPELDDDDGRVRV